MIDYVIKDLETNKYICLSEYGYKTTTSLFKACQFNSMREAIDAINMSPWIQNFDILNFKTEQKQFLKIN